MREKKREKERMNEKIQVFELLQQLVNYNYVIIYYQILFKKSLCGQSTSYRDIIISLPTTTIDKDYI